MVATLVRLKLRLFINGMRQSSAKFVVVIFSLWGVGLLIGLAVLTINLRDRPELFDAGIVVALAAVLFSWLFFPLLSGMTDSTVDPSRLAHLPVGGLRFVAGLTAAATVGLLPLFFFIGLLLTSLAGRSFAEISFAAGAACVLMTMCVITAQVGAASMSGMLRGRKTRDIAAALLAVFAMSAGLFAQFGMERLGDVTQEQVEGLARWARWTPGGWVGQAVAWSRNGEWLIAIGALLAAVLFIVALGAVWWSLLQKLLTTTEDRGGDNAGSSAFVPGFLRLLPGGEPVHVATARALRSVRRDPREWSAVASQLPLLLVIGFPVASIDSEQAVLFAGTVGVYGGLLNSNLFGVDGRAIWMDLLAAPSLKPILWGKTIAHAIIVVPILVVMVVALAVWKDGWRYVIPGATLAIASFGCISGTVAWGSVRHAMPLPDVAGNPFGGQASGQTASQAFMLMFSLLVGFIAALPVLGLVIGLSLVQWWLGILTAPIAIGWGFWIWSRGVEKAAEDAAAESPELLDRLTLRA